MSVLANEKLTREFLKLSGEEKGRTAVQRRLGEYCRSLEAKSMASGGILLSKICVNKENPYKEVVI